MAVNRYRFFLQNRFEYAQTVVTIKDGEAVLTRVPQLSLIQASDLRKKATPPATLAYFDAMTCEAHDLAEFLDGLKVPLFSYKLEKTHIGYFYSKDLKRLKPTTNDETLQGIASRVQGDKIYENDKDAYSFIYEFLERLEADGSNFVPDLIKAAKISDGYSSFDYSIPESLISFIAEYHNGKITNSRGYYFSMALEEDLRDARSDIVKSLESYKNFREIYRFTKAYDLGETVKQPSIYIPAQPKKTTPKKVEDPASKQKKLGTFPGQMTLFDYLESKK